MQRLSDVNTMGRIRCQAGDSLSCDGRIAKNGGAAMNETLLSLDVPSSISSTTTNGLSTATSLPPRPKQKIKRRVVKKGFYSDEEDESVEEVVDDPTILSCQKCKISPIFSLIWCLLWV